MTDTRTQRIAQAFGAAADHYEDHAGVQRVVATTLAGLARNQPLPTRPRVLEIGCGTGLLTRELRGYFPDAEVIASDIAPEMVAACARDSMIAARFMVMDGERPEFDRPWFDLIISSLAFQWFADLPGALARLGRLLRPGGTLMFATMAQRSFHEWRAAHGAEGVVAGTPEYPSVDTLRAMLRALEAGGGADAFLFEEDYVLDFGGAAGLHRHLKGIGATVPAPGRAPLSPATLRRVMRRFNEAGGLCTYHVAFCRVTRLE